MGRFTHGKVAQEIRLGDQFRLAQHGDVARRLGHHPGFPGRGHAGNLAGVHHPHYPAFPYRYHGRVSPTYTHGCFRFYYHGPSYFPRYCWYPRWTHWVDWSWHYRCSPLWDPRPLWCRPVIYVAAPAWTWWECPAWTPLPVVTYGTWVDVAPVVVPQQFDLQMLAVRFVDPGHPDENLGPRYRVWFRNNSDRPVTQPFSVVLLASDDGRLRADLPQAGVRVTAVEAGDVQSVDVRLPLAAYDMGRDAEGRPLPFATLHVLVDADRELGDVNMANNGANLARAEIPPVDPAAFEADPAAAAAGSEVLVAGEGFGPEPGKVLVHLGGVEMEAEILGWYDLGVRLVLPNLPLAGATEAELIIVRGDGLAANPLNVTVGPPQRGPEVILAPPGQPQ